MVTELKRLMNTEAYTYMTFIICAAISLTVPHQHVVIAAFKGLLC